MNPIDYEYFDWLISQAEVPSGKSLTSVFERMHNLDFVWFIPNDDNRVQDGLDLRSEFLSGSNKRLSLPSKEATVLEVTIGLSRRLAFIGGGTPERCVWKLLKNLRLNKLTDPLSNGQADRIDDILYNLVWRTYDPDGFGGFFPLRNPFNNQTNVEIWDQMNAYVNEMNGA